MVCFNCDVPNVQKLTDRRGACARKLSCVYFHSQSCHREIIRALHIIYFDLFSTCTALTYALDINLHYLFF